MLKSSRRVVPALLPLFLLLLAACSTATPRAAASQAPPDSNLALVHQVMTEIEDNYVVPVKPQRLVVDGLKGMLARLDPHSEYLDETEYQELISDSEGEFAGIGIEISRVDRQLRIISPIDDTPAANAGLRPGDVIALINGEPTDSMTLHEAVDRLRGQVGSVVTVTIDRGREKPFDVTLTRAIIRVVSVKSKLEPGRIAYARIASFGEHTDAELMAALRRMRREAHGPLRGFVLDLRNDPGGLLDSAVEVAGDFLDGGVVVTTRGRHADDDETFTAPRHGDQIAGVPMMVLINGASASASEIVAGALQDRHRATLLGTRSFGKGSVQTIIPLDGQGALRLTTARYYTPSGRSIQGEGIVPDTLVLPEKDATDVHEEIVHEANLPGALKNDTSGRGIASPAPGDDGIAIETRLIGTAKDNQLKAALEMLRHGNEHRHRQTGHPRRRRHAA
jgi:carboxyl-terminal processing protease